MLKFNFKVFLILIVFVSASCIPEDDPNAFNRFTDDLHENVANIELEQQKLYSNIDQKCQEYKKFIEESLSESHQFGIQNLDSLRSDSEFVDDCEKELLYFTAEHLFDLEKFDLALAQYEKANDGKYDGYTIINEARCLIALGKTELAKVKLESRYKTYFQDGYYLANYYEMQGDTTSAIEIYSNVYEKGGLESLRCHDRIRKLRIGEPMLEDLDLSSLKYDKPRLLISAP
ncbi:MAG: hypothetical protein MK078_14985 [Crocinitomicaceae bacterium]|nr:hypothetical protein [Crocinitomicaceae bacterium]